MSPLIALLQFLPSAVQAGIAVKDVIEQVTGKVVPTNGVEVFAAKTLGTLPALIAAGSDILGVVTHTTKQVNVMLAEERGPTDVEWAEQASRIAALEQQLKDAAKP